MSSPNSAPVARLRRWFLIAAAIILLAAAADTAAWFVAVQRIEAGIPAFKEQARLAGWSLDAASSTRTGWPLAATVRFQDVLATRNFGDTAFRWKVPSLDVTLSPTDPARLHVEPAGQQMLDLLGRTIPLGAGTARLAIPLAGGTVTLAADSIQAGTPQSGLAIGHLTGTIDPLSFGLGADGIVLTPALSAPFAGPAAATMLLAANQPVPDGATPAEAAGAWQKAGGKAAIPSFLLQWGPLEATATATLGLDSQLQPEGDGALRVTGAKEVLDAASRAGLVAPGPASAIGGVLGLLTLAAHGGPVTLPLKLHDRTLSVAQFPVLRVPTLAW